MKKIMLTVISLFAVYATVSAQNFKKDIFGIRAGLNSSSIVESAESFGMSISAEYGSRISFHAGFSYQHLLIPATPLYLETGLYFTEKGFKQSVAMGDLYEELYGSKVNANAMYLKAPLLINYHFTLANNITIQPFAGFYVAYGIGGKIKYSSGEYKTSVKFFNDNAFEHLDLGLKVGVGATFDKIYVGIGYEPGLINIDDTGDEGTVKTKNWAFSIGYNF
ncbi:MAG: PorT family protein [Prevotellaceae bacterium]|nr:PorT family protein [Prevotellaceae bacterium]